MVDKYRGSTKDVNTEDDDDDEYDVKKSPDLFLHDKTFTKNFLDKMFQKQLEIAKQYRIYRHLMTMRMSTRLQKIASNINNEWNASYKEMSEDIKAQIWVASGVEHKAKERIQLKNIKCHIKCQEDLSEEISYLKTSTINMESQIQRLKKIMIELGMSQVTDAAIAKHIAQVRKSFTILHNTYEFVLQRESLCKSENTLLRDKLIGVLHRRANFNTIYQRFVRELSSGRKYLQDASEVIFEAMDFSIEAYERMDKVEKRTHKEFELRKTEMMGLERRNIADSDNFIFWKNKASERTLADLEPKEYKRRAKFTEVHTKKKNLYHKVLNKVCHLFQANGIEEILKKYEHQQSQYYTYFNYANELSHCITTLNNRLNGLYEQVGMVRGVSGDKLNNQLELIADMEQAVIEKQESNQKLAEFHRSNEEHIQKLFEDLKEICEVVEVDTSPLQLLLGDYTMVNLVNFRTFLKLIEKNMYELLTCAYITERQVVMEDYSKYVVRNNEKVCDIQTDINDIVLTQQCAECAEGGAFQAVDDAKEDLKIMTLMETKKALYDKIVQPEMQYLLHNLSMCRLPRSRQIVARRDQY